MRSRSAGEGELVAKRREAIGSFFSEIVGIAAAVESGEVSAFLELDRHLTALEVELTLQQQQQRQ
jgi:hypothetical protein